MKAKKPTLNAIGVLIALLLAVAQQTASAQTCPEGQSMQGKITEKGYNSTRTTDAQESCLHALIDTYWATGNAGAIAALSSCVPAGAQSATTGWTFQGAIPWSKSGRDGGATAHLTTSTGGTSLHGAWVYLNNVCHTTPPPPPDPNGPCSEKSGQEQWTKYSHPGGDGFYPGAQNECQADGCLANCDDSTDMFTFGPNGGAFHRRSCTYTGQSCGGSGGPEPDAPPEAAEQTVNDQTVEPGEPEKQMIIINDNDIYVNNEGDISNTEEGPYTTVIETPDGGIVTPVDADTPPAPDNGTAGEPAPPDLEVCYVSDNGIKCYNVYDPGTVEESEGPAGPGTGDDGDGPGAGDGSGDDDGGQDQDGDPEGTCQPDSDQNADCSAKKGTTEGPGLGDAKDFGESLRDMIDRMEGSPLGQAIDGAGDGQGGGGGGCCPKATLPLFGKTYVVDAHCAIWPDVTPVLRAAGISAALILALWIFMRA